MAEATKIEKTVVEGVTLKLSSEEAEAVMAVVGAVTGDRFSGPRKHTDSVWLALKKAGITNVHKDKLSGVLTFRAIRDNWV